MKDILIIGGGPAGLTAAIYAARAGKSVTVCEKESLGGQITQAHEVQNYPGIPTISGMELGDRLCSHAMDCGAEVEFTAVTALTRHDDGSFTAETEDGSIDARAVIFAGGAKPRALALPREEELVGRGISYCALCDGGFFRDQDVAVVGGGNTAIGDALYLAAICRSVTVIHRREEFRAEDTVLQSAKEAANIRFVTSATADALHGENALEGLTLRHRDGSTSQLDVTGLFVALGRVPDLSLLSGLTGWAEDAYAAAGEDCLTTVPGLFVAGDCRAKEVRQLTTAVADGTTAATAACHYLDKLSK
ncbi:MAG: FAD-dependent oxidoreductase [Ruminococcaceae bacterium]|nr:FAD-dependent oxidoreductase [Oscillospiraceae bacterium]